MAYEVDSSVPCHTEGVSPEDSPCRIDLWNPGAGDLIVSLIGHDSRIVDLTWHPRDDFLASASPYDGIILWDPDTGESAATFGDREDYDWRTTGLAWHPDGTRIASAQEGDVLKWLDPNSDGRAGRVVIWDIDSGRAVRTLRGQTDEVTSLAWHPSDGRYLATGNRFYVPFLFESERDAYRIVVWDVDTGKVIATLQPPDTWQELGVMWEPSGRGLTVWPVEDRFLQVPGVYTEGPCQWLDRNLGYQDWRFLVGDRTYRAVCANLPKPSPAIPIGDAEAFAEWALSTLEGRILLLVLGIILLGLLALLIWAIVRLIRRVFRRKSTGALPSSR
jgi:hypothetical protein